LRFTHVIQALPKLFCGELYTHCVSEIAHPLTKLRLFHANLSKNPYDDTFDFTPDDARFNFPWRLKDPDTYCEYSDEVDPLADEETYISEYRTEETTDSTTRQAGLTIPVSMVYDALKDRLKSIEFERWKDGVIGIAIVMSALIEYIAVEMLEVAGRLSMINYDSARHGYLLLSRHIDATIDDADDELHRTFDFIRDRVMALKYLAFDPPCPKSVSSEFLILNSIIKSLTRAKGEEETDRVTRYLDAISDLRKLVTLNVLFDGNQIAMDETAAIIKKQNEEDVGAGGC